MCQGAFLLCCACTMFGVLRFGVHRVKTLGTVPTTVFPHVPVFAHHSDSCTFWFGQQLGLPGGDALFGPVLLRKHQGARCYLALFEWVVLG